MLKWFKWEFWPFWFFYIPLYVKYLWLSLKAGTMAFFTAANPLMEFGGLTDYSKYNVLKNIPKKYLPETILLTQKDKKTAVEGMEEKGLTFPIILKPDKGERGFGVEKIDTSEQLNLYFSSKNIIGDLILQEYVAYPIELGVMYSRKASEQKGEITSVVIKEFLRVTGDGSSTLEILIKNHKRSKFYADQMLEMYSGEKNLVLHKNEEKELVAIGNHCRGTTFLNANHLINDKLNDVFNQISLPIKGYHFGRFDLRVPTLDDLYEGKNIKIMELNGAASEPAHIYDPNMSLFKAYHYLFAHWQRLYEISIENHKNGIPYAKTIEVYKALRRRGEIKKSI